MAAEPTVIEYELGVIEGRFQDPSILAPPLHDAVPYWHVDDAETSFASDLA
jgi:hypothetical protein